MPAPRVGPEAPPEFHPEFGYFWPAPQFRRVLRVALISTACGAAVGALAVFAGLSARGGGDRTSAAGAPASLATVGRADSSAEHAPAHSAEVAPAATRENEASGGCRGQTWPYLAGDCLAKSESLKPMGKDVRVLRPDQPAQSAPAMVIAAPSGKEALKAEAEATAAKTAAAAREEVKKERRHRHVRRARRPAEPENYEAYAMPYRGRYEPRRDWGWQW